MTSEILQNSHNLSDPTIFVEEKPIIGIDQQDYSLDTEIKNLRKIHLNTDELVAYVKRRKLLTEEERKEIDVICHTWCPEFIGLDPKIKAIREDKSYNIYMKTFAIKKMFPNHYVFIHAQSTSWIVFSDLVKELIKLKKPEINIKHYKFIRYFHEKDRLGAIDPNVCSEDLIDHDELIRRQYISVDGYLLNSSCGESALSYLRANSNQDEQTIPEKIREVLVEFYPHFNEDEINSLKEKILATYSPLTEKRSESCGNLFVFCIPKDSINDLVFRSHPLGRLCDCHPQFENKTVLELLQTSILGENSKCKRYVYPQYRLYTPALAPGRNQKIFLFSASEPIIRKKTKIELRALISNSPYAHKEPSGLFQSVENSMK